MKVSKLLQLSIELKLKGATKNRPIWNNTFKFKQFATISGSCRISKTNQHSTALLVKGQAMLMRVYKKKKALLKTCPLNLHSCGRVWILPAASRHGGCKISFENIHKIILKLRISSNYFLEFVKFPNKFAKLFAYRSRQFYSNY
jgi:hypothetical protein